MSFTYNNIKLKEFVKNTEGLIAILFSLIFIPLIACVGAATDYSVALSSKSRIQNFLDATALAGASLKENAHSEDSIKNLIIDTLNTSTEISSINHLEVKRNLERNTLSIDIKLNANVKTKFLNLVRISDIPIQINASAESQQRDLEIALVLDISSSMKGQRIEALRPAALDFVDTIFDSQNIKTKTISVIPFGGSVRLPSHFFRYVSKNKIYKQNGSNWEIEFPKNRKEWNVCISMNKERVGKIDLEKHYYGIIPQFSIWNHGRYWCSPSADATALFLSNSKYELKNMLNNFNNSILADGTGTDVGMGWGIRALDSIWRGKLGMAVGNQFAPRPYDNSNALKSIVLMGDGATTAQHRPPADWDVSKTHIGNRSMWDVSKTHIGNRSIKEGKSNDIYNKVDAFSNFLKFCDYAKRNEIVIFTIAFMTGSRQADDALQECASSGSHFFRVADLDIEKAFSSIAEKLNSPRLIR